MSTPVEPSEATQDRSWRPWLVESLCALAAIGFALLVTTHLAASSGRGEMMFLDGDSVLTGLFARSILEGTAYDWAMSASLFVPELALFTALAATGWSLGVLQFLSAVLNFVLLYLVLRVCAMMLPRHRARSATAALVTFLIVMGLVLLEGDGGRYSLEVASLLAMTTYYSASLLAALLAVGLATQILTRPTTPLHLAIVLGGIVTLSTFSNPLFAAWAVLPLLVLLAVVGLGHRQPRAAFVCSAILVAGSALGFVLRIPVQSTLVTKTASYLRPQGMGESLKNLGRHVAELLATPNGWVAVLVTAALMAFGIVLSVLFARSRQTGPLLLALYSWFAPVATTVGFVVMGSEASRYLQLWAFAPALALLALFVSDHSPLRRAPRSTLAFAAIAAVSGMLLGAITLPAGMRIALTADEPVACAVDWVNSTERIGAGQFWSIRAIKAYINDPGRLLQVNESLAGYGWLVDRGDYLRHQSVSFLIEDAQSQRWVLPSGYEDLAFTVVECGRFQIIDFGDAEIPVGPRWP